MFSLQFAKSYSRIARALQETKTSKKMPFVKKD